MIEYFDTAHLTDRRLYDHNFDPYSAYTLPEGWYPFSYPSECVLLGGDSTVDETRCFWSSSTPALDHHVGGGGFSVFDALAGVVSVIAPPMAIAIKAATAAQNSAKASSRRVAPVAAPRRTINRPTLPRPVRAPAFSSRYLAALQRAFR